MWDTEAGALSINVYPVPLLLEQGNMELCSGGALEMVSVPVGLPGAQPALQGTILLWAVQYVCPSNLPLRTSSEAVLGWGCDRSLKPLPQQLQGGGMCWQVCGCQLAECRQPRVHPETAGKKHISPALQGLPCPGGQQRTRR